jgi:hypothetical protein
MRYSLTGHPGTRALLRNGEVVTNGNPRLLAVARSGCREFRDSHRIIRLMLARALLRNDRTAESR